MKKQLGSFLAALVFFTTVGVVISACKKTASFTPPVQALFVVATPSGNYSITAPGETFKIPVGLTAVAGQDRTINISVSSSTGAQQGTHYSLSSSSITIPAGKVVDTLTIFGVYDQYLAGRKDSLTITLSGTDFETANFNNTFKLKVTGPCFEGDVASDLNAMLGDYTNSNEDFGGPYGPYTTTISSITSTGPTSAKIVVENIFDFGWNPIEFTMDWSDVNDIRVTLVEQSGIADGGTINGAYAGEDVSVRPHSNGQAGTFSYCNQTVTIYMQLGITGLGWFNTPYILQMER